MKEAGWHFIVQLQATHPLPTSGLQQILRVMPRMFHQLDTVSNQAQVSLL